MFWRVTEYWLWAALVEGQKWYYVPRTAGSISGFCFPAGTQTRSMGETVKRGSMDQRQRLKGKVVV
jgi:hypothetical protein